MSRLLALLEDGLICLLLTAMIALACLQIVMRQFFSGGFLWADPLLRNLVLWSGMIGAVIATRKGKHIAMDIMSFLLPDTVKPWLHLVIHLFSLLVAAVLTWASIVFVRNEAILGGERLLTIPSWGWGLIFPVAFSLITFHFALLAGSDFLKLARKLSQRKKAES
jgi:TRAP-type C4-dicarboxylate transport system permease small subunit